ncbi:hypothetical protein HYW76_01725 [Candidatus Pacearchaeota archaeon]|nr:hypothetical protein [Candidatus Pacearchaeota archaeon]
MVFSFRYKPIRLKSGDILYKPLIPITIDEQEKINVIGILDSGSDITIIPKDLADYLQIEILGDNEVTGLGKSVLSAKQGKINVKFGRGREIYAFKIPVLIPINEDVPIIIGRLGFFNQFKITFVEQEKRVEFKKVENIENISLK